MAGNIWLIGMMGSGKSTVGRALGEHLGRDFVDVDDTVTSRMGCSIADFWGAQGEQAFRDMEAAALQELATRPDRVISTGGGAILRTDNVAAMRASGLVIWLQAAPDTLEQRIGASSRRPLLAEGDRLETLGALLDERAPAYEQAAHASVATDDLNLDVVVTRIEELWNEF